MHRIQLPLAGRRFALILSAATLLRCGGKEPLPKYSDDAGLRATGYDRQMVDRNVELGAREIDRLLLAKQLRPVWQPPKISKGGHVAVSFGQFANDPFSLVITAQTGDAIQGVVATGECQQRCVAIRRDEKGSLRFMQPSLPLGPGAPPLVPNQATYDIYGIPHEKEKARPLCQSENGSVITALVAYTAEAAASVGGKDDMEALILANAEMTSHALLDSGIPVDFQVLKMELLEFNETGKLKRDLHTFTAMTKAKARREELGADVVFLIVADANDCGLSWLLRPDPAELQNLAFSLVRANCLTCSWSMSHELGHILGACHERINGGEEGCSFKGRDTNYGYRDPKNKFGTLMATGKDGVPRLLRFSTPAQQCGTDTLGTPDNDNVSWLRKSAPIVARFRCTQ
jgi:hypothetical protein